MSKTLRNTTMRIKMDVETKGLVEANKQIDETRRNMERLERTASGASGGVDETTESLRDLDSAARDSTRSTNDNTRSTNRNEGAQDELTDSLADRERSTRRARDAQNDLTDSTRRNREELTGARRRLSDWSDSMSESGRRLQRLGSTVQKTGKKISSFGQDVTSSMGKATLAVGMGVGYAVKQAADYEQAMKNVESLMSASEWQQSGDAMNKMVVKLGSETKYSSKEVAGGLEELIKAGVSTQDILAGGLKDALNLSTAGGLDLAKASEVMSTALNAFTKDAISSTRAADLLAGAANASATDVQEMSFGLSQSAAVANTVGFKFEENATALAVFAQNSLKGSDGGTSLKTMLMRLSPQTDRAREQMEALGLATTNTTAGYKYMIEKGITPASRTVPDLQKAFEKLAKQELGSAATKTKLRKETEKLQKQSGFLSSAFFDQKGNVKSMSEVFELLHDKTKNLSNEQKLNAFNVMFGSDAIRGAAIAADQGAKGYKAMNDAMQGTTAAGVAADKMKTLYGSLNHLKSAANTLASDFGTALIPTIKGVADGVTDLTNWFNSLDKSTKESAAKWTMITLAGGAVVTAFGLVSIAVGGLVTGVGILISAFGKLKSGTGRIGGWLVGTRRLFDSETSSINRNTDALRRNNRQRNNGGGARGAGGAGGNGGSGGNRGNRNDRNNNGNDDIIIDDLGGNRDENDSRTRRNRQRRNNRRRRRIRAIRGVSKVGKIIPYAGAAIAATSFIGADKDELGGITGEVGGSLAGGAAGAALGGAIGSVVPGVGTVIGGALGGIIGSVAGSSIGKEFGSKAQDSIKKHFPTLDEVDITKNVSKGTASAIKEYEKLNNKASEQLNLLHWSGEKISKDTAKSLKVTYEDMAASIEGSMSSKFGKSEKTLKGFMQGSGLSKKEQSSILKDVENNHEKQKRSVEKYQKQINSILDKASKKRRSLTSNEKEYINKLQEKMQKSAVKSMSKSAKEQRTILTSLKNDATSISAMQSANVVKQSKKARDGSVKEAEKKYKDVIAAADAEYYDNQSISKKQYESIVKSAKDTRDESVSQAEDMHKKVVKQAKLQADGHIKEVDWETGEVLSRWQKFQGTLAGIVNSVSSGINSVLKAFGSDWEIPMWNPPGYTPSSTSLAPQSNPAGASMPTLATGGSHGGGHAVVGEEGPELAYTPYGGARLVGASGAEIVDLPKGTQVLTASQTAQMMSGGLKGSMPGYAKGIGSLAKSAWNTTKEVAGNVADKTMDFISDPTGAIEKLFDKASLKNDMLGIGTASLKKMKDGALNYVQEKISSFAGFGGDPSGDGAGDGASGSYKSLQQLAQSLSSKYGLRITSGYRPGSKNELGQPDDHSKGLAIDLAGDSTSMWKAGLEAARSPLTRYVIANNRWTKNHGASWEHYPWGAHSDHVHISAKASAGKKLKGYAKGGRKNNHDDQVMVGENGPELVDLPFGTQIHNNRKTNELLSNKGQTVINFNPTVQVTVQGGTGETTESQIERAVNKALEATFKELRGIFNSGVAY